MPLYDHFAPPLSRSHPWRGFHSAWAAAIARHLNHGVLPAGYYAIPTTDLGGPIEIDVATLQDRQGEANTGPGEAFTPWAPPQPTLTVTLDLPAPDPIEVHVLYDDGQPRLAAAVELVSPGNKDRPETRRAFAVKAVGYLQEAASVIVVDVVTTRRASLHAEILRLLELNGPSVWQSPTDLYAVAYRATAADDRRLLQAWPEPLAVGSALPGLPLWLGSDVCVPLDLEATYGATCQDLRIRRAGVA
jgi:hypothetical protein